MGKPAKVRLYVYKWFDIETDAGWGEGADQPPICIQSGFLHSRPNKKQKIPIWKFKSAQIEDQPGDVTIIPAANLISKEMVGSWDVPHRK